MDYGNGFEDAFLVGAEVTAQQHADLMLNADLTAVPVNLDSQIGGALAAAQAAIEARNIPAGWMTSGMTWRFVIGIIGRIFQYVQVFCRRQAQRFFASGVTLDSTFGSLTQGQRNALSGAAVSMGLDVSGITGATTIRQALKIIADQIPPIRLAGQVF